MASTTTLPPQKIIASAREVAAPVVTKIRPYLVFAFAVSLYLIPFVRLVMRGTDEGILLMGAVRTCQGQLLGQDFFEVVGPGSFYWLALFFKLFGITFLASRICLFITSLGTALALYFLSRRICCRYQVVPCMIVFSTYFATFWPEISHHVDSNFFALLAVCCIVLWRDTKNGALLFLAGAFAGATALTVQPKGILLLVAFTLWIWTQIGANRRSLKAITVAVLGFLVVVGALLGYFWLRGALGNLIYANVLWPAHNYGPTYSVPYAFAITEYFKHWVIPMSGFNWTIGMAAMLFVPFLLTAALPFLLPLIAITQGVHKLLPEAVLYWLAGVALWLSEIHRKDITHLVFGSPLLVVLLVYYLQKNRKQIYQWPLQAIAITAASLAAATLMLALVAHPFKTRAGTIYVTVDQPEVAALIDHVPAGENVFIYPYAPMDYFLSKTVNPTRYSTFCFNSRIGDKYVVDEVMEDLEKKKVKYVLWDQDFEKVVSKYFPSSTAKRFVIAPYLNAHYLPIWSRNGTVLLQRKDQ